MTPHVHICTYVRVPACACVPCLWYVHAMFASPSVRVSVHRSVCLCMCACLCACVFPALLVESRDSALWQRQQQLVPPAIKPPPSAHLGVGRSCSHHASPILACCMSTRPPPSLTICLSFTVLWCVVLIEWLIS